VSINLTSGGKNYVIDDTVTAVVRCLKPDGTIIFDSCTIESNVISFDITENMSSVSGLVECEITLYGVSTDFRSVTGDTSPEWQGSTYYKLVGTTYTMTTSEPTDWDTNYTSYYVNALQITSPRFCLIVDDTVQDDSEIESVSEFTALAAALARLASIEGSEQTRINNENERIANENQRKANELLRIAHDDARKNVYVRYTDDPNEGELSPTKEEGMSYFGLYEGKTASTNISDYQWFNVEGDIDDIINQVLDYAKDTGINGWKFTKDNQNRCFLISNTNKTYLIDNGTIGCEKIILYDSTGYIEVDIDSFKSDNITPVYHEDDYGHLMEVQDSTINEIPTKEWVVNYVEAHGGSGVPELNVNFLDATPSMRSSEFTVVNSTI